MIIDLTLTALKLPGLENYTPPFGTKKSANVGLTTLEGCQNITRPFEDQRPVVITESSSTTAIESNRVLLATESCQYIDLGEGGFIGAMVRVINATSHSVTVRDSGKNVAVLSVGLAGDYMYTGTEWAKYSGFGGGSGTENRRYLYPAVFPLANKNTETNYKVINDESHPKDKLYIRAGATLPSFYVNGVGLMQYHTDTDVMLGADDCDDTCNGFEPGKDYFIYLIYSPSLFASNNNNLGFKISLNDPDGISIYGNSDYTGSGTKPIKAHAEVEGAVLTDENCFCIGGFHTVCSDKTDLAGEMTHPLIGYSAGDVHPYSVWDRCHRPKSTTVGMSYVPTIGKWCGIYLASERTFCKTGAWGVYGGIYPQNAEMLVSVYNKAYATGVSGSKYHCLRGEQLAGLQRQFFPDINEFVALSLGSPQSVNIASSAGVGKSGGHKATNGKDIVSYCGIEDAVGVLWQCGRVYGGKYAADTWVNNYDANDHDAGGQSYQQSNRVLLGGAWSDGVRCGSRAAAWNNGVLYLHGIIGFRLLSESAKN